MRLRNSKIHLILAPFFLLFASPHPVEAAEFEITPIVLTGDSAPEGGTFTLVGTLALNNPGAIAFGGTSSSSGGIYVVAEGGITRLVKPGDAFLITCTSSAALAGFDFAHPVFINDSGDIVFGSVFGSPSRTIPTLLSGGTLANLLGCPDLTGGAGFTFAGASAMNNTGTIAVAFTSLTTGFPRRHFLITDGTATPFPLVGTPAPGGGTIVGGDIRAINDSGDLVVRFITDFSISPQPGGLFLESGGSRIPVAATGDLAIEGKTFRDFLGLPAMNNAREIVFTAQLSDFRRVLFHRAPDGTLRALVREGDPIPGGGTHSGFNPFDINENGDVAFNSSNAIFFLSADGTLSSVVRGGDTAPGGGNFSVVGELRLNNDGDIAFRASLSTGRSGIFRASPSGLKVDFVDPVPDLLDELNQTADQAKDRLAAKVETVDGVAADGVARVIVRVTAPGPGTVELTLLDGAGTPLASAEEAGFLTQLGQDVGSNSLSVPTVDVPGKGPMAFGIYRAPTQFVRAGSQDANAKDRQVSLRVRFIPQMGGGTREATAQVKIARPPVVLVHGLWSFPATWDKFRPLINDNRFHFERVDYSGTADASFGFNALLLNGKVGDLVRMFKRREQVAAVQADVVAHSFGGLVVRQLALLMVGTSFIRDDNFLTGDINKLIAIAVPHLGSELARALRASRCLGAVLNAAGFRTDRGAIADMVPGNVDLDRLNRGLSPIRLHAVVGIASPQQKLDTQTSPIFLTMNLACAGAIPSGGLDEIFGTQDHDLLVEASSQRGSFNASALTVSTFGPPTDGVIHSQIPEFLIGLPELGSQAIAQRVILLLSAVPESELFDFFLRLPGTP